MARVFGTVTGEDLRSMEQKDETKECHVEGSETVAMLQTVQKVGSTGTSVDEVMRVKPGKNPWVAQGTTDEARRMFLQSKERIEAIIKELRQASREREQWRCVMPDGSETHNSWGPANQRGYWEDTVAS